MVHRSAICVAGSAVNLTPCERPERLATGDWRLATEKVKRKEDASESRKEVCKKKKVRHRLASLSLARSEVKARAMVNAANELASTIEI
jgi:hypothetical protein